MTEEQQLQLTADPKGNYQQLVSAMESTKVHTRTGMDFLSDEQHTASVADVIKYLRQYSVHGHDVFNKAKRPDKIITDNQGNFQKRIEMNKIALPFQQIIASRHAAFLCANPVQRACTPQKPEEEKMLAAVNKVWNDNKLDFDTLDMAEKWMSETEVAELWYSEPLQSGDPYWEDVLKGNYRLRMRLIANSLGDRLFPVFDTAGNMIAFGREYYVRHINRTDRHFDVYTNEKTFIGVQDGRDWQVSEEKSFAGKIPVIYYKYPGGRPIWDAVQTLISRKETKLSNLADTNDYFDSPIMLLTGKVSDMPDKTQVGKVFEMEEGGKAEYLEMKSSPDSKKMEFDLLEKYIYSLTDTPDISFENMKMLARASDFDAEAMFMSAHLKAAKHAGPFGKGIQRRINFLKAAIGLIDTSLEKTTTLQIKPVFSFYGPKSVAGLVTTLTAATGGDKLLSQETAVTMLQGLLGGVGEEEYQRIQEEKPVEDPLQRVFNNQP